METIKGLLIVEHTKQIKYKRQWKKMPYTYHVLSHCEHCKKISMKRSTNGFKKSRKQIENSVCLNAARTCSECQKTKYVTLINVMIK